MAHSPPHSLKSEVARALAQFCTAKTRPKMVAQMKEARASAPHDVLPLAKMLDSAATSCGESRARIALGVKSAIVRFADKRFPGEERLSLNSRLDNVNDFLPQLWELSPFYYASSAAGCVEVVMGMYARKGDLSIHKHVDAWGRTHGSNIAEYVRVWSGGYLAGEAGRKYITEAIGNTVRRERPEIASKSNTGALGDLIAGVFLEIRNNLTRAAPYGDGQFRCRELTTLVAHHWSVDLPGEGLGMLNYLARTSALGH